MELFAKLPRRRVKPQMGSYVVACSQIKRSVDLTGPLPVVKPDGSSSSTCQSPGSDGELIFYGDGNGIKLASDGQQTVNPLPGFRARWLDVLDDGWLQSPNLNNLSAPNLEDPDAIA